MIFVGIDQSYTCTGIVALEEDKIIYQEAYKPKGKGIDRLRNIEKHIGRLVFDTNSNNNDILNTYTFYSDKEIIFAIEGYSFMSGKKGGYDRLTQAGELNATIRLALSPYLCVAYPPRQHRSKSIKYVGGDKKKIVELVNSIYGTNIKQHDIADAYSIAVALKNDFTKLKNMYGTILFDNMIKKTPFKNLTPNEYIKFEECIKNG